MKFEYGLRIIVKMKTGPLVGSKLLDRKWKSKDQEIHKQRIREVKSAVRTLQAAPYVPNPMIRNFKKEAMLECKCLN